jgi:hypothetical protein
VVVVVVFEEEGMVGGLLNVREQRPERADFSSKVYSKLLHIKFQKAWYFFRVGGVRNNKGRFMLTADI